MSLHTTIAQMGVAVLDLADQSGDPPDRLAAIVGSSVPSPDEVRNHVLRGDEADYRDIHALQLALQQKVLVSTSSQTDVGAYLLAVEHPPVYTLGRGAALTNFLVPPRFPVYRIFRGGEVTYHGPGQLVMYPIFALEPHGLGVRDYVCLLEGLLIDLLADVGIIAARRDGFPGVWTQRGKIASVGIGVKRGIAYHGISLNLKLEPDGFAFINPCGMQVAIDQVGNYPTDTEFDRWATRFSSEFEHRLADATHRKANICAA